MYRSNSDYATSRWFLWGAIVCRFFRFFESLMAVCLRMYVIMCVCVLLGSLMYQRTQHVTGDGECAIAHSGHQTENLI